MPHSPGAVFTAKGSCWNGASISSVTPTELVKRADIAVGEREDVVAGWDELDAPDVRLAQEEIGIRFEEVRALFLAVFGEAVCTASDEGLGAP